MGRNDEIIEEIRHLPYTTVSHSNMLWNKTGAWRYVKPLYKSKLASCSSKCPCDNDIAGFIFAVSRGEFITAYEIIKRTNPFPGVCGRVCYHPCEVNCNRAKFDEPISIHIIERFLSDYMSDRPRAIPEIAEKKDKRIAVVGSGPAGLSCAYHLALKGYSVVVFEACEKPGGMLRYGVPSFRLPEDILDREIRDIIDIGVDLRTNSGLGKDFSMNDLEEYDAVFLAFGAHKSRSLGLPGESMEGVFSGLEFLERIKSGREILLGRRLIVIGGGNTAIDTARSALRCGSEVVVVYRRSRDEMPARQEEVEDAIEEGVKFIFLASPVEILSEGGVIEGIRCQKMELGELDQSGRRRPIPVKDSDFTIDGDSIAVSIGEEPEISFLSESFEINGKKVVTDFGGFSSVGKIFAGGDMVYGVSANVSSAIGSGRVGAESIDHFLRGEEFAEDKNPKVTEFEDLNVNYFKNSVGIILPKLRVKDRQSNFSEIEGGVSPEEVIYEAERCFSCGFCTMCDNCVIFCPDIAIRRKEDGSGYEIDYDYCKGCGICFEECPRGVISIERDMKFNEL
ncbi:NAD(P)-binding protein [candidate division KSB1 bacterium]